MKISDVIRRAGRSLRQAKTRTILTSLAISVGAFTVTLALAAGAGGKAYTDNLIKNNGDARSLSVFAKVQMDGQDEPKEYGAETSNAREGLLVQNDVDKVKAVDGVESVTPMYNISALYMQGPNDKKYETDLRIKEDQTGVELVAGNLKNNQPSKGKVLMSEDYVASLGFENAQNAIGKPITLRVAKQSANPLTSLETKDMRFTIEAVDKKSQNTLQYQSGIRVSATDGQAIYEYQTPSGAANEYYGLTVRVADSADPSIVQQAIKDKGYEVFSLQDIQTVLFTFVNVVMYGAAGFGALAILASIFGIINTQYISVLERTQQIGLMKALGARRKDIGRLFRFEAAWVGFLGGLIGTVGALLVGLANPWITKQLDLEPGTKLLIFEPLTSVLLIIGLMVVAVLAGYFPSRKAAKLDPIEALRTE